MGTLAKCIGTSCAGLCLALSLSGCGGGGGGTSGGSSTPETPAPAPAPAPETPAPAPAPAPETPAPTPAPEPPPLATPEPEPPETAPADPPPAPPVVGDERPPPTEPSTPISESEALAAARARLARQPMLRRSDPVPAWTRGTGRGQTVVIFDEPLDVEHPEFAGRVHPLTDVLYQTTVSRYSACQRTPTCQVITDINREQAQRDALVRVTHRDYPTIDSLSTFYRIGTDPRAYTYAEIPALREKETDGPYRGRSTRNHGTAVASVAVGKNLGVAPEAHVLAFATPLGDDQAKAGSLAHIWTPDGVAEWGYRRQGRLTPSQLQVWDSLAARWYANLSSRGVVINRSYGPELDSVWDTIRNLEAGWTAWRWIEQNMPRYVAQVGNPVNAIVVTAAGNDPTRPGFDASLAYFEPQTRGRYFAVVGVDETGEIHRSSARCRGLPSNWNAATDGRHYCLAAPWYMDVASSRVVNGVDTNYSAGGTSISAPIVSGAIALMAEQFPGLTRKELGRRLVDTADNSGTYADSNTYGAGLLDLAEATSPQGPPSTGLDRGRTWTVAGTRLRTPAAWGNLGGRLDGAALAGFDDWNAPFFYRMSDLVSPTRSAGAVSLPFVQDATQTPGTPAPAWPGLSWSDPVVRTGESGLLTGLSFGYAAEAGGTDTLGAYGLSWAAREPRLGGSVRAGVVFEEGGFMGGRGEGAFSGDPRHGLAFGSWSRSFSPEWAEVRGVSIDLQTLWAGGRLTSGAGMLRESGGLYSQHQASVSIRPGGEGGSLTRLTVAQPLRAEAGDAVIRRPTGRRLDGSWIVEDVSVALRPDAREVRVSLRHERDAGPGRAAVEMGHALDAGHWAGRQHTFAGVGYRVRW